MPSNGSKKIRAGVDGCHQENKPMPYFAKFQKIGSSVFRFDTRIYLSDTHKPKVDDRCIAGIVGKNPGSAFVKPGAWNKFTALNLGNDKMLPTVRNAFLQSYKLAGTQPPDNGYVIVWNLFYLCNPSLGQAIAQCRQISSPANCPTESMLSPRIVWYAWGGSHRFLNTLKLRFNSSPKVAFYYDYRLQRLETQMPSPSDSVKHPQGLKMAPVVHFLSNHL